MNHTPDTEPFGSLEAPSQTEAEKAHQDDELYEEIDLPESVELSVTQQKLFISCVISFVQQSEIEGMEVPTREAISEFIQQFAPKISRIMITYDGTNHKEERSCFEDASTDELVITDELLRIVESTVKRNDGIHAFRLRNAASQVHSLLNERKMERLLEQYREIDRLSFDDTAKAIERVTRVIHDCSIAHFFDHIATCTAVQSEGYLDTFIELREKLDTHYALLKRKKIERTFRVDPKVLNPNGVGTSPEDILRELGEAR